MDTPPIKPEDTLPPMFKQPLWRKWLWPVVGIVVALALALGGASYFAAKNEEATPASDASTTVPDTSTTVVGEKWLDQAVKLADLSLFTASEDYDVANIQY